MGATLGAVGLLVSTAVFVGGSTGSVVKLSVPSPAASAPSVEASATASAAPGGVPSPLVTQGAAALGVTAAGLYALPAAPVQPQPCPPPPPQPCRHNCKPPPVPVPKIPLSKIPAPLPVPAHTPALAAVSGKGMWLTTWRTSHVDVPKVVAQAKAAGLTSLWVRTGGYKQGYYGNLILRTLLPAAHAAGLKVIAWDFPSMSDPQNDATRARAVLKYTVDGQQVDGFSPDIETISEGTFNNPKRIRYYLSLVRRAARGRPVVATVMRPTTYQLTTYPYAAEAPYVDAFAPMVYWSCNEPGNPALQSISLLKPFGKPVTVIGQAYDMADEGGRHGVPRLLRRGGSSTAPSGPARSARASGRTRRPGRRSGSRSASTPGSSRLRGCSPSTDFPYGPGEPGRPLHLTRSPWSLRITLSATAQAAAGDGDGVGTRASASAMCARGCDPLEPGGTS